MRQVLEGEGTLRTTTGTPAEWQVQYRFVIDTNLVIRPGFKPAIGKSHPQGTVTAINGDSLPEGYYQLTATHDGEIMRVQSHGSGAWYMLGPIA
jgi:hypothetical protein